MEPGGSRGRTAGCLLPEGPGGLCYGAHRRGRHGLPVRKCQQTPGPQSGKRDSSFVQAMLGYGWHQNHLSPAFTRPTVQRGGKYVTRQENLEWVGLGWWRRQWHPTPVLLPGKSHGRRSLVGCSPWGREESDTTEQLHFHFSLSCTGEGNGNPLQCSCLENPRDGGLPSMGSHRVGHD